MKNPRKFPLWVVPALLVMAVGTIWLRLSLVRTTYSIHGVEREIRTLQQLREQNELKVTELRSPRRLEILARQKFNLTQPSSDQVVYMHQSAPIRDESRGHGGKR